MPVLAHACGVTAEGHLCCESAMKTDRVKYMHVLFNHIALHRCHSYNDDDGTNTDVVALYLVLVRVQHSAGCFAHAV